MVVFCNPTPERVIHPPHLGEVYTEGGYARIHDLCGHPQCGNAPGVTVVRDPTDHHWVLHIPVAHTAPQRFIDMPLQDSPDAKTAEGPVWRCYMLGLLISAAIALPVWWLRCLITLLRSATP
jgi:hypothetical protein